MFFMEVKSQMTVNANNLSVYEVNAESTSVSKALSYTI